MPEAVAHDLVVRGAALVAAPERGYLRVTGADRATWLQGLLSNDIEALVPGRGCYAAWLTPQGRMLTDVVVTAEAGADALMLDLPASLIEALLPQLEAAIFAEDVAVADETRLWRTLGVHGAHAAAVVARAASGLLRPPADLAAEMLDSWLEGDHAALGADGIVRRSFTYGVPGFWIRVDTRHADAWRSRFRLAGAVPAPIEALDYARIEAGRPEFLVDMDADTIPLEAGIEERAISFTKGCYVGQEVIVRILHRGGGRVARRLVGLRLDGTIVPTARSTVRVDGKDVGRVTSAAWSPRLGRPVALAYIHRDIAEPGRVVFVAHDSADLKATVGTFPLS